MIALPPIFSLPPLPTTTSHLYTTHQRVLGSGNGGLERVGRSGRFGKREGIGKDTGKSNQPPLCIPANEPPHPPSALLPCPHTGPLYPKQRPPTFLLPKLSPSGSGFGFLVPTSPPSRHVQLLAPTTSNVVYSTPFGSPLPENDCRHISLAKTEPRWLGLGFWPQLGPPSHLTPSLAPTTLNLVYFTPIGPPLPENK